ncbi:YdeI/OmpD-associated family protein [Cellulomonas fimi]|uniref:DUF1905 domain-containing protein n=1 Tax=Cellulomonas fimi (strain ATCC 484 / DSM 20113 / JCM 1341 / CCUG 24087 / LMG 16345 / NBRC 15513 / NCIMB 8980 / NCTC 7547 / NRS-133) TaxID=590998 RepID=F4GY38_CELFA|nr:YdeI/OmpD-associated family protein [Cellulomonas fimi]AEE44706.1 Domain of unknown function DUF1905 [Cellulomonas fimi ATCC 484]NNH06151.1 DUF1905 domain-containing protein [Cellulomonas fimi]VEH27063.1 Uncharacterized protein conserved in bacteria [Cellulomonas fimi]
MRFRTEVEPHEPMRGLEVPPDVVRALDGGARPRVVVTLHGHRWSTRVALLRGRHLIGLSNARRAATGVQVGDHVDVDVELDTTPVTVDVPDDVVAALVADPGARRAFDGLTVSRRRQHVRTVESARTPATRARRVAALLEAMRTRAEPGP